MVTKAKVQNIKSKALDLCKLNTEAKVALRLEWLFWFVAVVAAVVAAQTRGEPVISQMVPGGENKQ